LSRLRWLLLLLRLHHDGKKKKEEEGKSHGCCAIGEQPCVLVVLMCISPHMYTCMHRFVERKEKSVLFLVLSDNIPPTFSSLYQASLLVLQHLSFSFVWFEF